VAKLTHAVEFECEAPLAQHALSPANALDAASTAATTKAVLIILFMASAETGAIQEVFNLYSSFRATIFAGLTAPAPGADRRRQLGIPAGDAAQPRIPKCSLGVSRRQGGLTPD